MLITTVVYGPTEWAAGNGVDSAQCGRSSAAGRVATNANDRGRSLVALIGLVVLIVFVALIGLVVIYRVFSGLW